MITILKLAGNEIILIQATHHNLSGRSRVGNIKARGTTGDVAIINHENMQVRQVILRAKQRRKNTFILFPCTMFCN